MNGRSTFQLLQQRYQNEDTLESKIAKAKNMLDNLVHKNERAFPFERFQSKFEEAHRILALCGRPRCDADKVDGIWKKMQCPNLSAQVLAIQSQHDQQHKQQQQIWNIR